MLPPPIEDGAPRRQNMYAAQKSHFRSTFSEIASSADQSGAMLCERVFVLDPDLRRQFAIDFETHGANPQGDETVIDPANSQDDAPLETSIPVAAVPLQSIVRTEELLNRPSRPPDHKSENSALTALVSALVDSPRTILQALADKVLEVLHADSAGLSLLTKDGKRFYWAAIAGAWRPHVGGGTPRDFGPCGDVLDHNIPMLFSHWERRYPYLSAAMPLADEGLLVPFYVSGKAVGTIWAIAHSNLRKFDSEDLRLLNSLSRFASAAYQTVKSIEELKLEIVAREKAELELLELTNGLEAQVRIRTEELRQRSDQLAESKVRLAEEKRWLERSEAHMAEAQRLSHSGSWHLNVRTGRGIWSQETYAILGIDPKETRPSYPLFLERVHPEDRYKLEEVRSAAVREKKDFEAEFRLRMPDDSIKHLHMVAHGSRDQNGALEYIGAVQDVTERRLSEQTLSKLRSELAQMARVMSLGALTASIADEVNQPLSGIITNASTCLQMLSADPPNVDGARETARRTIRDGKRASDVIARLRVLFSKKHATTEALDLNEATREVIALSRSELERNRAILRLEFADDLALVRGDRVQLQQVILNLLRNASEAMSGVDDRPRQLVIRTERDEGDHVRLSVQDAGVGFEPDDANRLFEAFYTTKSGGMGIGLSVSHSIIESHSGRLWARPNDGPGSTFSFSIPSRPERLTGGQSWRHFDTAVTDAVRVMRTR
jgi:signal transduction histidine kinase